MGPTGYAQGVFEWYHAAVSPKAERRGIPRFLCLHAQHNALVLNSFTSKTWHLSPKALRKNLVGVTALALP